MGDGGPACHIKRKDPCSYGPLLLLLTSSTHLNPGRKFNMEPESKPPKKKLLHLQEMPTKEQWEEMTEEGLDELVNDIIRGIKEGLKREGIEEN